MRNLLVRKLGCLTGLTLLATGSVGAADLVHLVDVLTPILTVQQFQALCATTDPKFMARPWSVIEYATHMKGEVVAGLSAEETTVVINAAAGAALQKAKGQLRLISRDGATIEPARVAEWCSNVARPFIQSLLVLHDDHHDTFNQAIAQAKEASSVPH
ncbi:MAG: hypothetical protein NVSMB26_14470 [Beijerinckiaceae bacterium]